MQYFIPLIQCAIGLILLLKGADFTVRGAENLAGKHGVSSTTIGLTLGGIWHFASGTGRNLRGIQTGELRNRHGEYNREHHR